MSNVQQMTGKRIAIALKWYLESIKRQVDNAHMFTGTDTPETWHDHLMEINILVNALKKGGAYAYVMYPKMDVTLSTANNDERMTPVEELVSMFVNEYSDAIAKKKSLVSKLFEVYR